MKYFTIAMLSIISTKIYADAYVFGGSTHFQGRIVQNSCTIHIDLQQPDQDLSKITTDNAPRLQQSFLIEYSLCEKQLFDLINLKFNNKILNGELIKLKTLSESFQNDHVVYKQFYSTQAVNMTQPTLQTKGMTVLATYP